jgi:hypothetical protein
MAASIVYSQRSALNRNLVDNERLLRGQSVSPAKTGETGETAQRVSPAMKRKIVHVKLILYKDG